MCVVNRLLTWQKEEWLRSNYFFPCNKLFFHRVGLSCYHFSLTKYRKVKFEIGFSFLRHTKSGFNKASTFELG